MEINFLIFVIYLFAGSVSLNFLPKQKEYKSIQESDSIEWPTLLNQSPQDASGINKPQTKKISWAQAAARPTKTKPAPVNPSPRYQPPNKPISDRHGVYSHEHSSRYAASKPWFSSSPQTTSFKKSSSAGEIDNSQHLQQSPVSGHQPQNPAAQHKRQRSPVPKTHRTNQTRTRSESSKDQVQYGRADLHQTVSERESLFPSFVNHPQSFQQGNTASQAVSTRTGYSLPLVSVQGQQYPYVQSQQPAQVISQTQTHVPVQTGDDLRQVGRHQHTTWPHMHQIQSSMNAQTHNHRRTHTDPPRRLDHSPYIGIQAHLDHKWVQPQSQNTVHQQQDLQRYNDPYRHSSQQHYSISQTSNVGIPQVRMILLWYYYEVSIEMVCCLYRAKCSCQVRVW